ncbi:MAG TPA: hypothetical protein VLW05_03700 [Gaiellaceae bacterium]|nr:hypothetical protein [Gaiellaceae bacterium]
MQDFERIYAEHADAVRAYVRRRAPQDFVDDVVACRVRYHRAKSRLAARLEAPASFRSQPKGVTR